MNKNQIITLLVILVGLMAITLIVKDIRGKDVGGKVASAPSPSSPASMKTEEVSIVDGKTNSVEVTAPTMRSVERQRPLEPEATKRLHEGPVVISALFEASGKGEHAGYGNAVRGSYLYTTTVIAQSEVVKKEDDKATGEVRVVERRKFLQARDNIALSDVDVVLALDTLPVDQVKNWIDGSCAFVAGVCTMVSQAVPPSAPYLLPVAGGAVGTQASATAAFAFLHKIDGTSARGMLGAFGVEIPENLEAFANERVSRWVKGQMTDVHMALQSIEGKSFLITYMQDANGKPLKIDYANEDGKPITDAEWEILSSANAFLDSNVVPDKRCRVGDAWTVWADEMQELFGAAGNGWAEGKIRVERVADQPNGDWTLQIEPAEIQFRTSDGVAAGKMDIKEGNGLVDAENIAVKSLHATARGNLRSLNKKRHFMFFDLVKRIEGDSNLRFTLTVAPAK